MAIGMREERANLVLSNEARRVCWGCRGQTVTLQFDSDLGRVIRKMCPECHAEGTLPFVTRKGTGGGTRH